MSSSGVINVLYVVRKASQYSTRSTEKDKKASVKPAFRKRKLLLGLNSILQEGDTDTHFDTNGLYRNVVLLFLTSRWTLRHKSHSETVLTPPAWLPSAALWACCFAYVTTKGVSENTCLWDTHVQ